MKRIILLLIKTNTMHSPRGVHSPEPINHSPPISEHVEDKCFQLITIHFSKKISLYPPKILITFPPILLNFYTSPYFRCLHLGRITNCTDISCTKFFLPPKMAFFPLKWLSSPLK